MQFPLSYFEDEVRDGFYVSGMMKRSWAAQLEILEDIDKVCKKYGIQYFAEWGTLLGAVRHGGFIPWDDDMDIGMKRADYNKFLAVAQKELPEGYGVLNFHDGYKGELSWEFLTRIVNKDGICFEEDFLQKFHGFPFVVGIDIFPMDFLAPGEEDEALRDELINLVSVVINSITCGNISADAIEMQLRQVEELCRVKIHRGGAVQQQLYSLEERLFSLYSEQEAEDITIMPIWMGGKTYKFPKSYYQETVMLPFENTKIPVPIAYDAVLRKKYGEYMKLVRKGGSHEYPVYKRQEVMLREKPGVMPLKYDVKKFVEASP